jgi:uncharacterized protein
MLRLFGTRFLRLNLGLFLYAAAVATMLEANIGLDPWTALHQGVSAHLGISIGRVTQITGLGLIILSWLFLAVRPGLGTLLNMLIIGPWLDLLREQPWFPTATGPVGGALQFLCGILIMGFATAVYIGARFGAGPRDGFAMGLAHRVKRSLRTTRVAVELCVLAFGFALGGSIGWGTLLFAVTMGPVMQASLRIFHVSKDPSPR